MKYMVLIYSNPESRQSWEGFSPAERGAGLEAYAGLHADLAASGELLAAEALAEPARGHRVVVPGGRKAATDGPFAESTEHLAGFFLLDCATIERAMQIAAHIPEAELGLVEVRPVEDPANLQQCWASPTNPATPTSG
jgi:hypothetical protein